MPLRAFQHLVSLIEANADAINERDFLSLHLVEKAALSRAKQIDSAPQIVVHLVAVLLSVQTANVDVNLFPIGFQNPPGLNTKLPRVVQNQTKYVSAISPISLPQEQKIDKIARSVTKSLS